MAVPQALLTCRPLSEGRLGASSVTSLNLSHSTRHADSSPKPHRTRPSQWRFSHDTLQQRPYFLCSVSYDGHCNTRLFRHSRQCAVTRLSDRILPSLHRIPRAVPSASPGESLTEISVADADQPFDKVADGIRPSRRQSVNTHFREIDGQESEKEISERSDGSSKQSGSEKQKGLSDNEAGPISPFILTQPLSTQSSYNQGDVVSVPGSLPVQDEFSLHGSRKAVITSLSAKFPKKLAPFSNSYSIASENLRVLLSFEDDSFAISEKQLLGIFNRFPSLLAAPLDAASVQSRVDLFRRYGVTRSPFFDLCSRSNVLLFPVESLAENLHYLRHDLGVVRIEKVLKCFPLVLNLSLPNLEEKVRQLRLAGLGPASEVLERSPFVLSARASEIQRKVELVKRLLGSGNSAEDPILYLRKFPHVLLAQYETMERTYEGMVKYFGEEDTKRLLRRQPLLLGQNWDGMMDTISKLIDVFGREGAVRIVNQTPTVMAYSWSTIEDKILFVTEVMGRSIAEIVVWPALLTRSVEKRLRPRYEMLRELPREQQLGLGSMFGCTDEVFRKRYGRKIVLLAERKEGAEDGENGLEAEDGGGEKGGGEEGGAEKRRGEIEGDTTGAEVEERGR